MARAARVLRDTAYLTLGKYGQYFITLVTVPFTARVLGVEGTGELAIAMSAYFFGAAIVDYGLTQLLIPRAAVGGDVGQLRSAFWALRFLALSAIALLLGASWVLGFAVLSLVAFGLLVGGLSSANESWILLGDGRFGHFTATVVGFRVAYLICLVLLLPAAPEAWAAMAILGLANLGANFVMWLVVRRRGLMKRPAVRDVIELLGMGLPALSSRLLGTSYTQGAALIYAAFIPAPQIGLVSAGDKIVRSLQSLFDSLGSALLPRIARATAREGAPPGALITRMLISVFVVGVAASTALTVTAPWLVLLVFGGAFAGAVPLFQVQAWLLPFAAVTTVATSLILYNNSDARGMLYVTLPAISASLCGVALAATTGSIVFVAIGAVVAEAAAATACLLRGSYITSQRLVERG